MSSYPWALRRFWFTWFRQSMYRHYMRLRYGMTIGGNHGTTPPVYGRGVYASVLNQGGIIRIIDHMGRYDEIRIIPAQYNHGIMVETVQDGQVMGRNLLTLAHLTNQRLYSSENADYGGRHQAAMNAAKASGLGPLLSTT